VTAAAQRGPRTETSKETKTRDQKKSIKGNQNQKRKR
jgi:hypothetical protein